MDGYLMDYRMRVFKIYQSIGTFYFYNYSILTVNQALPKFSDPIIWIFISGFVLAAALKNMAYIIE
jgi:di/tricarboxylate transporter